MSWWLAVRDTLGALLRNPVAVIVLVAVVGIIFLAAKDKEVPFVLSYLVAFLMGTLSMQALSRRG